MQLAKVRDAVVIRMLIARQHPKPHVLEQAPLELDRFTNQQQLTRALNESANDLVNLQGVLDKPTAPPQGVN